MRKRKLVEPGAHLPAHFHRIGIALFFNVDAQRLLAIDSADDLNGPLLVGYFGYIFQPYLKAIFGIFVHNYLFQIIQIIELCRTA
jgi:hypothetical protein